MVNKEVVIVIYDFPWDFSCDYIKQISLSLSKKADVLLVNPLSFPTIRNILFDSSKRGAWSSLFQENRVRHFPTIGVFPFQRFTFVKSINTYVCILALVVYFVMRFGVRKPILWIFSYRIVHLLWLLPLA